MSDSPPVEIVRTEDDVRRDLARLDKRLGRPLASPVLLHAARDLVWEGVPIAEAARRKGVARSTLQRFVRSPCAAQE